MSAYQRRTTIARPAREVLTNCTRCDGVGGNHQWPGFTCYRCQGLRVDPTVRDWAFPSEWTDEQCEAFLAKKAAQADARRERAEAKRLAAWEADAPRRAAEAAAAAEREAQEALERAAIFAANVDALPILATIDEHPNRDRVFGDFVLDILRQAQYAPLTERQRFFLEKAAKRDLKHAAA